MPAGRVDLGRGVRGPGPALRSRHRRRAPRAGRRRRRAGGPRSRRRPRGLGSTLRGSRAPRTRRRCAVHVEVAPSVVRSTPWSGSRPGGGRRSGVPGPRWRAWAPASGRPGPSAARTRRRRRGVRGRPCARNAGERRGRAVAGSPHRPCRHDRNPADTIGHRHRGSRPPPTSPIRPSTGIAVHRYTPEGVAAPRPDCSTPATAAPRERGGRNLPARPIGSAGQEIVVLVHRHEGEVVDRQLLERHVLEDDLVVEPVRRDPDAARI